ncbi:MAG: AAA family ATPase [Cyanobium sp.]
MLIFVLNQRGGGGKSTTAVHLARWLYLQGKSILLAEFDQQQTPGAWLAAADG